MAPLAPSRVTDGPDVCDQRYSVMGPTEPEPLRVICWPTTPSTGAVTPATGTSAPSVLPELTAGTVVDPPRLDVTVTVDGGARTPAKAVPLSAPKPCTVRTAEPSRRSLDVASTVSVCASASYAAAVTLTRSMSGRVFFVAGLSEALTISTVDLSGTLVTGTRA